MQEISTSSWFRYMGLPFVRNSSNEDIATNLSYDFNADNDSSKYLDARKPLRGKNHSSLVIEENSSMLNNRRNS